MNDENGKRGEAMVVVWWSERVNPMRAVDWTWWSHSSTSVRTIVMIKACWLAGLL